MTMLQSPNMPKSIASVFGYKKRVTVLPTQTPQIGIGLLPQKNTIMAVASTTSLFSFTTLLLLLVALSFFSQPINGDEQHDFHTIQLSSLFQSQSCSGAPSSSSSSTKGLKNEASLLEVVHKHGPCAKAQQGKPSLDEILLQDQSRVKAIHSRSRKAFGSDVGVTKSPTIPAKDGSLIGAGDYIVTVGLGTPVKKLSLILDTGTDLTWTQCKPCVKSCYKQKEKMFEPSQSTSYQNVSCERAACSALASATGFRDCSSSTCAYEVKYGDSSFSKGLFASDKLTLTSADGIDDFNFGCGQNNQGKDFAGAAGLLGLGRNSISLLGQTSDKYKKLFSYCLPSTASSTGYLSFGATASTTKSPIVYTPITGDATTYGLSITAISVGGSKLPIPASVFSTAKAIIDSGAAITRLPPAAYSALRLAFKNKMSDYPMAPALSILDTCYDLSKAKDVKVPKIGFFFAGGAEVEIQSVGILYGSKASQMCLAFAGNAKATDVAIFGSVQQKTMEVVYDGAGGRIGFGRGGCS